MRTPSSHPSHLLKALFAVVLLIAAAGCGGGGSSSTLPNPGSNQICDPDAAGIQTARPTPGFPQLSPNTVEIVSATDTDQLHGFTGQFDLILRDTSGFSGDITTGFLSLFSDSGGPHPYARDFFYQGTVQNGTVLSGRTYNVYLNAPNTNCTPGFVGQIFT